MSSAPNLEKLVGTSICEKLLAKSGGLVGIAKLSDSALRHLGLEEFHNAEDAARARQLLGGFMVDAPIFVKHFSDTEVTADCLKGARKALALLSRKCVLAVKTDLSGGSPDGAMGAAELEKLEAAFERLLKEGKVGAVDTQALPVPEIHKRGEPPKRKRGGVREHKKRESQKDVSGVIERAFSRIKMGISEEVQREERLQNAELRTTFMKEQEKQLEKESRKRPRANHSDSDDEYADLFGIAL
ncbi:unnamed protein product [Phytomonas sp. EM1]|nr:unnamed protein product [Phytomonas sp. EM1]|eukprot:CCW64626.1 unnamed protein product [Phytomonas sp. isolate EM1]